MPSVGRRRDARTPCCGRWRQADEAGGWVTTCTHALGRLSHLPPEFYLHVNVRLGHKESSPGECASECGGWAPGAQERKFGTQWRCPDLNSAREHSGVEKKKQNDRERPVLV